MSVWQQYHALCRYYILRYHELFTAIIGTTTYLIEREVLTHRIFDGEDCSRKDRAKTRNRFESVLASNLDYIRSAPSTQTVCECIDTSTQSAIHQLCPPHYRHKTISLTRRQSVRSLQRQRTQLYRWDKHSLFEDLSKPGIFSAVV